MLPGNMPPNESECEEAKRNFSLASQAKQTGVSTMQESKGVEEGDFENLICIGHIVSGAATQDVLVSNLWS